MPTKKPRVQSILEPETYEKLKEICENECRSESQMIKLIIQDYVNKYYAKDIINDLTRKQREIAKSLDNRSISE